MVYHSVLCCLYVLLRFQFDKIVEFHKDDPRIFGILLEGVPDAVEFYKKYVIWTLIFLHIVYFAVLMKISVFDSKYIVAIAESSSVGVSKEKIKEHLLSSLSFDDPAKQYRYCFATSNSAIRIGDSELLELAIKKMHDFITSQPDFVIPDYAPGA